MKIINFKENYNQYNGYRVRKYELDTKTSNMDIFINLLNAFETDNIKIGSSMATTYDDNNSTGRHYFKNKEELLKMTESFDYYVFFSVDYINTETNDYAFSVVNYVNSNIVEQVFNPNKLSKKSENTKKINI